MRAGINRAEGTQATTIGASDLILVQQISNGQPVPRLVKYSNFITGGGTGLTVNTVPFVNSLGDFTQDNTNFNYVASTHTLTAKNLSVGASGLVGSMSLFSTTAAKGKWLFTPVDNTGDTTMTITNAAQAAAYTYTIPSAGASASFMMTQGAQTVVGNNLFSGTTQINTLNIGVSGTVGALSLFSGTASKGKWLFTPVDNTGDTIMTITNAAQAGAYTYTIPSAGASASFMMTQGSQTVVGAQTFSADITASANVLINTAGKGFKIKEGSNARMGTSTLSSGTVTVSNTSVTAASTRIFLSRYSIGSSAGAIGVLSVGTIVDNTSFVINALKTADHTVETADVSVVHWLLVDLL